MAESPIFSIVHAYCQCPLPSDATGRLLPQLNTDHDRTHDIVELEVSLRAIGMSIVATDTGLGNGQIGVHRFKIPVCTYLRDSGVGTIGLSQDGTESDTLERVRRDIAFVDRPQADQAVLHPEAFLAVVPS